MSRVDLSRVPSGSGCEALLQNDRTKGSNQWLTGSLGSLIVSWTRPMATIFDQMRRDYTGRRAAASQPALVRFPLRSPTQHLFAKRL